jgi:hypothetical protein
MNLAVHVIPGLIPETLGDELRLEYPRFTGPTFAEERVLAQGRAFRALGQTLASPGFLARAAELTGIDGLVHDPGFSGAGLRAARDGALPGWHDPHRRGWWPRVGVVVNLTPAWRDPWTDGAGLALLVPGGSLPDAVPLDAADGTEGPCLVVLATLYTREPPSLDDLEAGRSAGQGAAPAGDEVAPKKPVVPSLSDGFGREASRFEADLAALRALTSARGQALRVAVEREAQLARHLELLVERPFHDGTGALGDEEQALVRCVLDARGALLAHLQSTASTYREAARGLAACPFPTISGPVAVERCVGYWRDRWVTARFALTLLPATPVARVRLRGYIPPHAAERQHLTATVGGLAHRASAPSGELTWDLPVRAKVNEPFTIEIDASYQWTPRDQGQSDDTRVLAWVMLGVEIS